MDIDTGQFVVDERPNGGAHHCSVEVRVEVGVEDAQFAAQQEEGHFIAGGPVFCQAGEQGFFQ